MPTPDVEGGPALPSAKHAVHRPLGHVRLTGGLLGHWQETNRAISIPLALAKLVEAGNLDNLRLAAGTAAGTANGVAGEIRGPAYMDSDVHKMLETIGWELRRGDDAAHREFLRTTTDLLARAQAPDGYLNSHYQVAGPDARYTRLHNSHETYTAGHLLQAAVATYRCVDDEHLFAIARRLADHLVTEFLDGGNPRSDGHPEIETALVELYRTTGHEPYLTLAEAFIERRGYGNVGNSSRGPAYCQDAEPVRSMRRINGHAVRALYLEAGVVDLYLENGDTTLLASSMDRWQDMITAKTAITGGMGARQLAEVFGERYELPPDQAYNETCAAVAAIHWSWRLLLATGDGRYADLIERVLYNVFGASFSVDGRTYFKGNPLQRRIDHAEPVGDPKVRDEWFWSACCPPNVTRLISSLEHYVATTTADSVYLHLFGAASIPARLADGDVLLDVETDYPWDGTVRVVVRETPETPWTLALRIPAWSTETSVVTPDGAKSGEPDARGYVEIERTWRPGEAVTLELDLTPRRTEPHPRIDAVRGCVAIERGPLVYCVEQLDQPAESEVADLALFPDPSPRVIGHDNFPGIGRTVTIETAGVTRSLPEPEGLPYARSGEPTEARPTVVTAIPYFQWANRDVGAMRVWLPLHRD